MALKTVSIIKKRSNDTGEFTTIIEVFNKIVSVEDKYSILAEFKHFPNWLNDTLLKDGYFEDPESGEEFVLETIQTIVL